MKATGAIWGFCLALLPVLAMLFPIFRDNGLITAAAAATGIGILNLVLKIMQENKPQELSASRSVESIEQPSKLRRILLG